jgi:hypothetical protein
MLLLLTKQFVLLRDVRLGEYFSMALSESPRTTRRALHLFVNGIL